MTGVPGASTIFLGGVIAYANDVKQRLLGVPAATLAAQGAVSRVAARAMAEGIRRRVGADLGIAVTGIAGPTGGSLRRPVGLVWIAVATATRTVAWRHRFPGGRQAIRAAAVAAALEHLRRMLPLTEKDVTM